MTDQLKILEEMTMKAAVYHTFGAPICIERVPVPRAPFDGVVLQVKATGVCRSDWHGWKGHDGDIMEHGLPFCPGHEVSGVVVEVGRDVANFSMGDCVAVPFILSCGSCTACNRSKSTVCHRQEQPGFTQWGSFAQFVALPRADRNLKSIPKGVSFIEAAALGCRFTTAYRAVLQQGRLKPTETVAIFGCGGLGLSCIMIAQQKASIIIAIDVNAAALEKASIIGATHTILVSSDEQVRAEVWRITNNEGVDVAIDAGGFPATCENAVHCTRRAGRMVQLGLPIGGRPPLIPMGLVAGRELELIGSHGFAADDLPDLLNMVADGRLKPMLLVENCVTLEEGVQTLMDMDHFSPLGMTVITDFGESSKL